MRTSPSLCRWLPPPSARQCPKQSSRDSICSRLCSFTTHMQPLSSYYQQNKQRTHASQVTPIYLHTHTLLNTTTILLMSKHRVRVAASCSRWAALLRSVVVRGGAIYVVYGFESQYQPHTQGRIVLITHTHTHTHGNRLWALGSSRFWQSSNASSFPTSLLPPPAGDQATTPRPTAPPPAATWAAATATANSSPAQSP